MRIESCNISSCFLCTHCIPEWKPAIAVNKKTWQYKKGEQIFKEGDPVTGIYFLYSGSLKVHKQWGEEKELIIRFTKAGETLGHRGLAAGDRYPVSATTLEDSVACFISNSFLEVMLKTNPALPYTLMQLYAGELQRAESRMRDLALMEVKGRVAQTLLELHRVFGTNREKYIAVPVTRQDIAAYSGTTYETVFKILKIFEKAKTISTAGKSIRVNDLVKLGKIVSTAK